MLFRSYIKKITKLSLSKSSPNKQPLAMHSILLALEPRMVFDASLVAGAEALNNEAHVVNDQPTESHEQTEQTTPFEQTAASSMEITPASGDWNADPELDFSSGTFTVNEDILLTIGDGGITLNDTDSDNFRITIKVDHGTLALDYVAGVIGNQYNFNADKSEVSFEADKETVQKVLNTLKYQANKDYNGTDSLQISVEDGENNWKKTDFTQDITINSVADKPFFIDSTTLQDSTQADEDVQSSLVFNHGTKENPDWKALKIDDADGTSDRYNIELRIKNGTLSGTGLGTGTQDVDSLVYNLNDKTLTEINEILESLKFQGNKDFYGKADFTLSITDTDPTISNDPLVKTFEIDVLAVNDAPVLKPADANDRDNQLTVAETNDNGRLSEGVLTLKNFNIDHDNSSLPNADNKILLFDVDNNLEQLMIKVDSIPQQGTLWRQVGSTWIKLSVGSTFSLMDVYKGNVKYSHNTSLQVNEALDPGSSQDHFNYSIVDGAGGSGSSTMYIALEPVNQGPTLVTDGGIIEAYEGEQGIKFSFSVQDPDQSPSSDYKVHFTELPNEAYGFFWYSVDGLAYEKVTTSTEISLEAVQKGYLRFNHSGKETAIGTFNFKLEVSDDGGGDSNGSKTTACSLSMSILPNNDHPEWNSSVKNLWSDNTHTVTVNDSRKIPINNSFLNAQDSDSSDANITYTVNYNSSVGTLLYDTGQIDGGSGNPIYRVIASGEKVSQADINSGNVSWWFNGDGNQSTDLTFIVRDGSITATPVPNDGDQPLDYPYTGSSASGWEHGQGSHEGAIGTWQETSPGSESYKWVPTLHTLTLVSKDILLTEEIPDNTIVVDPIPNFKSDQNTALVDEGKNTKLTENMLKAWFKDQRNGNTDILPTDPAGNPENLVYRIEGMTEQGHLAISTDGGSTFTILGLYSSFTQQDIINGKVYYIHNGSEIFHDSFNFSLSDGRNEAINTNDNSKLFELKFDIIPLNDTPTASKGTDVTVKEHDQDNAQTTTAGGIATITTSNIVISDVDGTGEKSGIGYATPNDLYIIITQLPTNGTLYLNGTPITALTDLTDLSNIKDGEGYSSWSSNSAMNGITVISLADIKAGKLTYQHNGSENYSDTFSYFVSDNKGIDQAHASEQNGGSVNGSEQAVNIVVTPVNDRPELEQPATPFQLDEGATATITDANIKCVDPDGTPSAIQFIVTEIPKYGELTLNGKVLGVGSVFTQKDINDEKIQYKHNGSEDHTDSFKYKLSDSIYMASDSEASTFEINVTPINDAPTVEVPNIIYVESIAGGVIVGGIKITDPDYGSNNQYDGASDTGIKNDEMTVELTLRDPNGSVLDLSKIELFFWDGTQFIDLNANRNGNTYTLVGSFEQIQTWLSQVKIQAKTDSGTTYDPNGDIHLDITVHDGVYNDTTLSWENANGSGDTNVYRVNGTVKVYISPVNEAPTIKTGSPTSLTTNEDGSAIAVKDGINPIFIEDIDAFSRMGNSITLTVEHGILLVTPISGPSITGRGSNTLTITGTLDQINSVLASLQYKANANYNGLDAIKYIVKDNANSGSISSTFNNENHTAHNEQFRYDTGRKDAGNNIIYGLGVYGIVDIEVKAVNDAPAIKAPQKVFITEPLIFGGVDELGNPARIELSDIDITGSGTYINDTLTLTINVDSGWLELADIDLNGVTRIGAATGYQTLTLQGSLSDLNNALAKLGYSRLNWGDNISVTLTLTLSDVANTNESNGSTDIGSKLTANHTITINCNNNNNAPTIDLPDVTVPEDDVETKIFNGSETITLYDQDTFDGQVFASISVGNGTLNITQTDLINAEFIFSGNPALQDKFSISADGKTIYFKASIDKINAALKEIRYKAPDNYNGKDSVKVYVNDCGLWGDDLGNISVPIPTNPFGLTGTGLASEQTRTINITDVNDAPTSSNTSKNFWDNSGSTQGDLEDTTTPTAKTVNNLFGTMFQDTPDNQKTVNNPTGSEAHNFAGIVITDNTAAPTQGTWQYHDGTNWVDITGVSIASGLYLSKTTEIRFLPNANFNGTPGTLSVRLADDSTNNLSTGNTVDLSGVSSSGGTTRYSASTISLSNYIRPVNDAPVASGSATLANISEDATNSAGNTVSNLFTSNFNDIKDSSFGSSANVLGGVVLVENTTPSSKGIWQYSTNSGSSWTNIPTDLSENSGLFLASNAKIRFVPVADYNGTPEALVAYLADNSTTLPTNATRVNISGLNQGGTTRYSDSSVNLTTTINPVNDAPTLKGGATMPSNTISEDSGATTRMVSDLFNNLFNDSKDDQTTKGGSNPNSFAGIAITAINTSLGTWEYSTNSGMSWTTISGVNEANALFLSSTTIIKFTPAANVNTSGEVNGLTARLVDDSSGTQPVSGTNYDVSNSGGITRYSDVNNAVLWKIDLTPTNDAPTIATGNESVTLNHTEDTTTTKTVDELFKNSFSDAKDNSGGSIANSFMGIIITDNLTTSSQGQWQYYIGSSWVNFPNNISETSGLYLAKNTQIRFAPSPEFNGTIGTLSLNLVENGTTTYATGTQYDVSGINIGGTTQISDNSVTLLGSVTAVNDAPVASNTGDVTMSDIAEDIATASNNGQSLSSLLNGRFSDNKDQILSGSSSNIFDGVAIVNYTAVPSKGQWQYLDGATWKNIPTSTANNAFILLDPNTMLRFNPAANFNGSVPDLKVALIESGNSFTNATSENLSTAWSRGGSSHVSVETITLKQTVTAVNDSPTLSNNNQVNLTSINEDTTSQNNGGSSVASLFSGRFSDIKDNVAGGSEANAFIGIWVDSVATEATKGQWQYYDSSALSWVSITQGMFIRSDVNIRFQPVADYNGQPTAMSVRLVESNIPASQYTNPSQCDLTTGSNYALAALQQNSVNRYTDALNVGITVTAVNDAPIADNSNTVTLGAVNEDSTATGDTVNNLFSSLFDDTKDNVSGGSSSNTLAGIIVKDITQDANKGLWQYSINGTTWINISANMFIQSGHLIRFQPETDFNGTPNNLTVHLVENSGIYSGTLPNSGPGYSLSNTGGSSAISSNFITLTTTVTAINDAPTWDSTAFSPLEGPSGNHFIYGGGLDLDRSNSASSDNFSIPKTVNDLFGSAFNDSKDNITGGSSANTLNGVWVTGISGESTLGTWQYSTDGTTWTNISLANNDALFLASSTFIRFAADITVDLNVGTSPHIGLNVALADSSENITNGTTAADISSNRGGNTAISEKSIPLWLTIHQLNYAPTVSNISSVTTTERSAVNLAPSITVSDSDLDHQTNTENWSGASITLSRNSGANSDDVFTNGSGLSALNQGGQLIIGGHHIGTVTRNSGGVLVLTFNNNATSALIASALQAINYTNTSHNPPASVELKWLVDDGNYEKNGFFHQGDNQPGQSSGKTSTTQVVYITPINDNPTAKDDVAKISSESKQALQGSVIDNDFDYEGAVSVNSSDAHLAKYGTLTINADGSYNYIINSLHPAIAGLKPGESLIETINYTIRDASGALATATLTINIEKPLPPPVIVDESNSQKNKESLPDNNERQHIDNDTTHNTSIAADKPVVREAALFQETLDRSTNHSLISLAQSLRNMESNLERAQIIISGQMGDQMIFSGFEQKFSLPEKLFRHSLAGEQLAYIVSLEDGSPLPEWLHFDIRSLSFYANPDQAMQIPLSIKIIATDRFNNKAVSIFRIYVTKSEKSEILQPDNSQEKTEQATDNPQEKNNTLEGQPIEQNTNEETNTKTEENKAQEISLTLGNLDLASQISMQGQKGLLYKAQESLRNLIEYHG
ncbi:cadherin-like domain-containing protein [Desulfovibrio litoralis]|uniref:VCBS repeat-containing protein n=1 Tax=Desulfovibrio litoralis DSM 11393 TaxID=1121455 RepID=A0A1M7SSQ7_9BACT|nr:cadherin-like domain-containing protein [Desulfovibrio litoralis]SHN61404.1 VCBS repeat-containing protein [Desulfovibrio litoralis DSM 11393]